MNPAIIEDLIRLPEEMAVQAWFDRLNDVVLRRLLIVLGVGGVIGLIGFFVEQHFMRAALWAIVLAVVGAVLLGRESRFYLRHARLLLFGVLVTVLVVVVLSFDDPGPAFAFAGFVFPALLILFRLRLREYLALGVLFTAVAVWFVFAVALEGGVGERLGLMIGQISMTAVALIVARRITGGRTREFLIGWKREIERDRESRRMRTELLDAREIQLSMLPKSAPALGWLDYSSISLPATEVGGDYFEYFILSDSQIVIAIGDVAGHGVASGLVLSGVRSGLHLLREQLDEPVRVLNRLNGMVRETAPVRMFVTLQLAVLDYRLRRLSVANAGHPPLLRVSASVDGVERLGNPGLPLGTGLEPGFDTVTQPLQPGDTLAFYSDGVTEIRDLRGESFGEERFVRELDRSARNGSARQTRDAILNSISSFKADVLQEDDLTLLVLKVR